ncbi:MAG TPA: universal stress protein [Gemmatimonadaceae bacterium]|nr:universal stress protein [Gemmatimonadaceae bacterium]
MRSTHDDDNGRSPGPLGHVVVGVDFTEPSLAMAQWVARHLARTARLTLVHVAPMAGLPNVDRAGIHGEVIDGRPTGERMRSLRGALRGLASVSGASRTAVAVRLGDPATQLAAYADLVRADLIVIGGSAAFRVVPDDGIPERLLGRTRRPVLVARAVDRPPGTVLATLTDGIDASAVIAAARMVATPSAARIIRFRPTARAAIPSHAHYRPGLLATAPNGRREILDAARRFRADIIVIASSGPHRNGGAGEGRADLAHSLVRSASCSVLVLRDMTTSPLPPRSRFESRSPRDNGARDGHDVTPRPDGPTRPAAICLETDGAA